MNPLPIKVFTTMPIFLLIACVSAWATAIADEPAENGGVENAIAEKAKPNIVLFFVDDFGQRDLSCYGSALYETPHMDQLAAQGMRFTDAYAAYPRCVPSRQGLLTGKYPARVVSEAAKSVKKNMLCRFRK